MNNIAKYLLESKAVHLQPKKENYFTWTSGKRSPIYCDNRKLISHPEIRSEIVETFAKYIRKNYNDIEIIAGTATAGIPWAAWISHELNLPMVYIRSSSKTHGLKSAIEGDYKSGDKTLVIEDLISTGKSSLAANNELLNAGLISHGVLSIFSYNLNIANKAFSESSVSLYSLCSLDQLLDYAITQGFLNKNEIDSILDFRDSL